MKVFYRIQDIRKEIDQLQLAHKKIGFVPTMGALHEGHLQLIAESMLRCDFTVCSIFVNPLQFNNPEDLSKYPRTLEDDLQKLEACGCSMVFVPSSVEIYPSQPQIALSIGPLDHVLEGKFRPGHFSGVALVVLKLFQIIRPDMVFFGKKDIQQCLVVRLLITELNLNIQLCLIDTLREATGLAFSSRNRRLTNDGKVRASAIYRILQNCIQGTLTYEKLESARLDFNKAQIELEYLEILDLQRGQLAYPLLQRGEYALCVACYVENIRLIDNLIFNV